MNLNLNGKVAMVAAASKGLGLGIAKALSEEGALVSIGSRDEMSIKATASQLKNKTGNDVIGCSFDATDPSSILRWRDKTIQYFGAIDCLVVNAGGPPTGNFDNFEDEDWQSAFELTLLSSVRMIRAVLPAMRKQGGGSILTITSSSIKEPIDILLLSNVMRSGVVSLAKSLSQQLAPEGIRVNNLVPGRIDTDRVRSLDQITAEKQGVPIEKIKEVGEKQIPLGRYGSTDDFGKAGAFLLSDAASYITGLTMTVDGGTMKTVW